MKKILAFFLVVLCFTTAFAENKSYIYPAETSRIVIGETIPAGDYYLLPINDINAISATLSYTLILDYASRTEKQEPRDYIQQPDLLYPENADHYVTLHEGDALLLFAYSNDNGNLCDVLLIPKGEDATGGLTGLSYDDLIALKNQINLAMWRSDEWQEVTVPQGVWKVGEDIPAGTWTVRCADVSRDNYMMKECDLEWGEYLSDGGKSIQWKGRFDFVTIYNPNSAYYDEGQLTEYILTVEDGDYIIISNGYNMAVFTPYTGKPSLGFK